MTKDAVAGRIRRLLAMADKRASDLGIPGTDVNLTADMLESLSHVAGLAQGHPLGSVPVSRRRATWSRPDVLGPRRPILAR